MVVMYRCQVVLKVGVLRGVSYRDSFTQDLPGAGNRVGHE
jgi:hypothetical protein